jgi:hypothetical protein
METCREGDAVIEQARPASTLEVTPRRAGRPDVETAMPKSRLPNPDAYIATAAITLALGTAMKVPAPLYWEVDPQADPFSGGSTLRAGVNTSVQGGRTVALGGVGTVLQAIGVGLLRRGIDYKKGR